MNSDNFYTETDVKLVDQLIERYQTAINLGDDLTYDYLSYNYLEYGICIATHYQLTDDFIMKFMEYRRDKFYFCLTVESLGLYSYPQRYIDDCLLPRLNRLKELRLLMN